MNESDFHAACVKLSDIVIDNSFSTKSSDRYKSSIIRGIFFNRAGGYLQIRFRGDTDPYNLEDWLSRNDINFSSSGLKADFFRIYDRLERDIDIFKNSVQAKLMKESKLAALRNDAKNPEIVPPGDLIVAIRDMNSIKDSIPSSPKKEEIKMANENNSKSAATSTRRENGVGAKEQASSFGKLMGTALQMAAVDQTGEVFLNMSKKFFGNNPSYEMLMESPQGREAMKLVTASVVRTILLSAPEAVKGSDGIVACADLQVTFSGAKLMGALMNDLGDQLAILSNLGGGLAKE